MNWDASLSRPTTYRVLVSTDLGGDPDDIQSLFRLVHYSDVLRVEGILSSPGPGSRNREGLVRHWIMRADADFLRARGYPELMSEQELLGAVRQGATTAGAPSPERATEGSDWLVERALAGDSEGLDRPLWVLVWGSLTDVAQALHDEPDIAPHIRVYSIGSSNTEADPESRDYVFRFMADAYAELWWIENGVMPKGSRDTFRGVYLGGNQQGQWSNAEFIRCNVRGHGSDRGGHFNEVCGDAFPTADWPAGVLKEGDSPSMLYLLSPVLGGVGDVDDPTDSNWGGRFMRPEPDLRPNYYTDLDADAATCQETINQWRVDFLEDWKRRWDRYGEPDPREEEEC
jgi:hypothetical protein